MNENVFMMKLTYFEKNTTFYWNNKQYKITDNYD